jgi:hypothetical protein
LRWRENGDTQLCAEHSCPRKVECPRFRLRPHSAT